MVLGVKVGKRNAEVVRRALRAAGLIDPRFRVLRDEEHVYFPVLGSPGPGVLEGIEYELVDMEFPVKRRRPRDFIELLEGELSDLELAAVPRAIDLVGDIAVIELPDELLEKGEVIGRAIMRFYRNVRAVYAKRPVRGVYRVRELIHLAGERRTTTIHREYGVVFKVDIARVFFSPRLGWERARVANLVRPGEVVVDMFTGVGGFAIHIARRVPCRVYAIDINPDAYRLLLENIRLNRVEGAVHPYLGDAREIVRQGLMRVADRVIMDNPSMSHEFVDVALDALKREGGTIHFYHFESGERPVEEAVNRFTSLVEACGRRVRNIRYARKVKSSAPYEWLIVVDGEVG